METLAVETPVASAMSRRVGLLLIGTSNRVQMTAHVFSEKRALHLCSFTNFYEEYIAKTEKWQAKFLPILTASHKNVNIFHREPLK